jgi:hypothetical protein
MAGIAGLRGTGDWGTDERPKNFREMILWREPNGMAPLTGLLSKMGSQATDDPEFAWYEEELSLMRVTHTAGTLPASTASTALVLSSAGGGLNLVSGDLLMVELPDDENAAGGTVRYEIVEVSSVTDDTNLVIRRAQCASTLATITSGQGLTKIGNRYAEGSNSPGSSTRNPTKLLNYCQIFKTSYEMTETAKRTNLRTGDGLKNDKKRKMFDHAVAMELAFFYGKKNEATVVAGQKLTRTTGGLREFINTNQTVFVTAPTVNTFLDAIYPVFDYNGAGAGNERLIFAGNSALNALNKMIAGNANVEVKYEGVIKQYGMNLQSFVTPQGIFYIKTHPLLNTHPVYTKSMFIVNPGGLKYRHLRDTKAMDNIQANDADTCKGQWLSECGLEIQHEKTFAYIGNMFQT